MLGPCVNAGWNTSDSKYRVRGEGRGKEEEEEV